MSTEHTPGPWQLWTSNSWRRFHSRDHGPICEPVVQNDGHPDLYFRNGGPDGPDARLIAQAPDLLAERDRLKDELDNARVQAQADRAFQSENARLKAEREELVRALQAINDEFSQMNRGRGPSLSSSVNIWVMVRSILSKVK